MNATIFIWVAIFVIAIYDIGLGLLKKKYITDIFREWYKKKPLAPYCVGALCIGHFQSLVEVRCIPFFISFSIIVLLWQLIMTYTLINKTRKFYNICAKYFFIPMSIGAIVGSFWRG